MSTFEENHVQEQPDNPFVINIPNPPEATAPSEISFYPQYTLTHEQAAQISADMAARVSTGSRPGSRFAQFKLVLLGLFACAQLYRY